MTTQWLIVALLVFGCSVYAVWTLMPGAARRAIAQRLLRMGWPNAISGPLQRAAANASGCGCDGCDRGTGVKPAAGQAEAKAQKIVFHRRVG